MMMPLTERRAPRTRRTTAELLRIAPAPRAHDEQLVEAQRIANVGSWEIDFATGRRTFSDQFCRIFGLAPGAAIDPEDRERVLRIEAIARETLQPVTEQFRLVVPGGPPRTIVAWARVVVDDAGVPLRAIGVVQDVSKRVAYEEELRRVAAQQAAIANFGQLALSGASLEFLFNQVTTLLRSIAGVEAEIIEDSEAGRMDGAFAVPIASSDERPWGILAVHRPAQHAFSAMECDFLRSVAAVLAQAIERARADAELRQLTRRLQLVLESTLEGICTIDAEGRCTMANAAAARMFGRGAEEMLGVTMHELVHARRADGSPFPRHDCPIFAVVRDCAPRTVIGDVFWRADGTPLPVDYSAAPIVDGNVTVGAVVAITDITARRKLEQNLEQATRLSSLGRLAATVAHEFNNVLMGISPFVDVIRRKPERTARALDQIAGAVARGKRVTGEILRFTRPAELACSDVAVEPWLRELAAEFRLGLPPKHDVIVDVVEPALRVHGDRAQLHQVLVNLLLNARDAMPDGGVVTIAARREERFVHVSVADSGCGVDEETRRHIFEPLFTTKSNGTGLGLAVAHQVVQRHGGTIFVESAAGAGATFHLFIPIAEGGGEMPVTSAPPPPAPARARHVLLVDDDEVVVAGLVALLELEGMRVDVAGNGAEALAALRRATPDVVLLDVGLPDMGGTEVFARIAQMYAELPVVFSTGHADTARLEELAEHRRVTSLLKPYDLGTLLEAIEKVVA